MGILKKARDKLRDARYAPPALSTAQQYEKQREIEKQNPDLSTSDRVKQSLADEEGHKFGTGNIAQWNERNKAEKERAAAGAAAEEAASIARSEAVSKKASEDKQRENFMALMRRRGRRASILTGGNGIEEGLGLVNRPMARGARLLGETEF